MTSTMDAAAFAEEAATLLDELDFALKDLREDAADTEVLAMTVRVLHTLNGAGRLFGFHVLAARAAALEPVFLGPLRDGTPVSGATLDEAGLACANMRGDLTLGPSPEKKGPPFGIVSKNPGG